MENKINKISGLKTEIVKTIMNFNSECAKEKEIILYQEKQTGPGYKITIEEIQEKFFIDSKGRKWLMASDSDD